MDLGKVKLRRSGINGLRSAVHPKHGLAWTDGNQVFLSPVQLNQNGELKKEIPIKLGEFQQVQSLCWSGDLLADCCLLCVVHTNTVSIWRVDSKASKLSFKQIRKINAAPIPQGCLWNPHRDILCILKAKQCSFYFTHTSNKGSYAFPQVESGHISCGGWSPDGTRLMLGLGGMILVYIWPDIDASISDFSIKAWKIPGVDGQICNIAPVTLHTIVCTAELPLEHLCKSNQNLFDVPDLSSSTESDCSGAWDYSSSCSSDVGIVRPKENGQSSIKESLFNLKTNQQYVAQQKMSSQVILCDLTSTTHPRKLCAANVLGILTPDLLHVNPVSGHIVIGSNMKSTLRVYSSSNQQLQHITNICLDGDKYTKGLCGVPRCASCPCEGVLVLLGQGTSDSWPAFPSSTTDVTYDLQTCFVPISGSSEVTKADQSDQTLGNDHESHHVIKRMELPNRTVRVYLPSHNTVPDSHCQQFDMLTSNPISSGANQSEHIHSVRDHKFTSLTSFQTDNNGDGYMKWDCSSPPTIDLRLPGSLISEQSLLEGPKLITVQGEDVASKDLATEAGALFSDTAPKFANNYRTDFDCFHLNHVDVKKSTISSEDSSIHGDKADKETTQIVNMHSGDSQMKCNHKEANLLGEQSCVASLSSDKEEIEKIENQLSFQEKQMKQLHLRMEEISHLLEESSSVDQNIYSQAEKPDLVYLQLDQASSPNINQPIDSKVKKAFILDNGKLLIDTVKQAFGLVTVELLVAGVPCVLGSNTAGFLPVKFTTNATYTITGRPALCDHIATRC